MEIKAKTRITMCRISLFMFIFIFFIQINLFSQSGIDHNLSVSKEPPEIKNELLELEKKFEEENTDLHLKLLELESEIQNLNKFQERKIDVAGKIIDWATFLFGAFGAVLFIAGFIASKRFEKIELIKKDLETLLSNANKRISKELQEIENLKNEFQEEQRKIFNIIFPILEGSWFFYQGDFQRSINELRKAQKIKPNHPIIIDRLNKMLVEVGEFEEAIKNLEELAENFPNDTLIQYRLAQSYRRIGNLDIAESILSQIVDKREIPDLSYELGYIKFLKRDYHEAEKHFLSANRNYVRKDGNIRYWVTLNLAMVQKLLNKENESNANTELARKIISDRLEGRAKNPQLWIYYSFAHLLGDKNYQKAKQYMEKALGLQLPVSLAKSALERIEVLYGKTAIRTVNSIMKNLNDYIGQKSL